MHLLARRQIAGPGARRRSDDARFRDLTELSADWFWETDAEHRITWISGGGAGRHLLRRHADLRQALLGDPRRRGRAGALEALHERMERAPAVLRPRDRAHRRARRAPDPHHLRPVRARTRRARFLGYRGVGPRRHRAAPRRARAVRRRRSASSSRSAAATSPSGTSTSSRTRSTSARGWARFLGRDTVAGVTRGAELIALVHPDDRPGVRKDAGRARSKARSTIRQVDSACARESGGWRWLHATRPGHRAQRDGRARASRARWPTSTSTSAPRRRSPSASSASATWPQASGEYVWEADARGATPILSERVEAVLGYRARRAARAAGRRTSCRSARSARCRSGSPTRRPTASRSASSCTA